MIIRYLGTENSECIIVVEIPPAGVGTFGHFDYLYNQVGVIKFDEYNSSYSPNNSNIIASLLL